MTVWTVLAVLFDDSSDEESWDLWEVRFTVWRITPENNQKD
jgi:hypothetical protein